MRPRQARLASLASCAVLLALGSPARAADLSGATAWLNVAAPLSTATLRGKVVALDFADDYSLDGQDSSREMQLLQAALGPGFLVVGVRSESPEDARLGVLRREIMFPVAVDGRGALAAAYGVTTRPEVVLLDGTGAVQGRYEQLNPYPEMEAAAKRLLEEARLRRALNETPPPLAPERDALKEGPLLFPTDVLFDAALGRLMISDTGHHRVVAVTTWGRAKTVVGLGVPFFADGAFTEAAFSFPEGLASSDSDLFVADTGHRMIRRLSFKRKQVLTYASGHQIGAPRGLASTADTLYSANPANHSVDAVDLALGHFYRFAGTGEAGTKDGLVAAATLEAPSAVAAVGGDLWVADSKAASLRRIPLKAPALETPALSGPGAPLVRPVALAALGDRLLVADAGDGRVKLFDPKSGRLTVFADGLLQPSGVTVMKREVIVADTGRSRLLRFSADGRPRGELRVRNLRPAPAGPPLVDAPPRSPEQTVTPQPVRSGEQSGLTLDFQLPAGYHLNPRAPIVYFVSETRGNIRLVEATRKGVVFSPKRPIEILFTTDGIRSEIILNVDLYYCRDDDKGVCLAASKRYRVILAGSPSEKSRRAAVVVTP